MGVPAFYRWLVNKYPKVVVKALEEKGEFVDTTMSNPNGLEFDNLYLDLNGIIHPCFHPDDGNSSAPTTFEAVFHNVCEYIDRLFNIVRPRKLLYMAIDGVAPRAKMNQQRSRRFRAAKDCEIREREEDRLRKQFEMEGKEVLPKQESEVYDSNLITPGTDFMHKLSKALQHYISQKITDSASWKDIMVILSDTNVSGEGEHKIMSFIRKQRSLPEYNPNTRHCLYGLDADLIMLALATHEPLFSILREDVLIREQRPKSAAIPFEFLHIWLLREYLELDLNIQDPPKSVISIDCERIIDDFIFMCFFAGNDFLPHMPTLEIHEEAIDLLITVYKKEFNKLGGYLVDMSRVEAKNAAFVKLSRVEKFILSVGTYEEKIFKRRSEVREKKLRRLIRDSKQEEENANSNSDPDNECSSAPVFLSKKPSVSTISEILQNTKDLKEQLNRSIRQNSDHFRSGEFLFDQIKLGTSGWKERYYKMKFSVESLTDIESKRKEVVAKYTEGLLWVLKYYYSDVPSWAWFYPYNYGPFASDFKGLSQVRVNFQKGVPLKPFDQLLAVLPARSAHALPKSYAQLMDDERSNIIDFYPLDFEVDMEGKRFTWQGICKIPFIEEGRLLTESRRLEKELTEEEALRNAAGADRLFVASTDMLATKIRSERHNAAAKFNTSISDGIAGFVRLCIESVEKVNLDTQEDSVLCLYYEQPAGGLHVPRLLPGLNLPAKTISENEIMDTPLWHERLYNNCFQRACIEDKFRNSNSYGTSRTNEGSRISFQSSSSASVIFKGAGAGAGWSSGSGSGRGKQAYTPNRNVAIYVPKKSTDIEVNRKMLPLGTAESNRRARQYWEVQFSSSSNGSAYQVSNTYNQRVQAVTNPAVRGRGRGRASYGSNHVNSWKNVSANSNSSLHPK